jgi:hypothetical protein
VRDPARGADQPRARLALRPRPARRSRRDRRSQRQGHVARARLRVLRDGVERHVVRGRAERESSCSATSPGSPRSPTATSRASSTSCTSGGCSSTRRA